MKNPIKAFNELEIKWKQIPGHPGYKINNLGDIVNPRGNHLTPEWDHQGYISYLDNNLSDHRETKHFRPHRLVGELFLDKPEEDFGGGVRNSKYRLVHLNGEHAQNSVLNLEWKLKTELDNESPTSNSEVQ